MQRTVLLSTLVAAITFLGFFSSGSAPEVGSPQEKQAPLEEPRPVYSLEEARKNPEAVETLILSQRGLKHVPELVFRLPNLEALYLSENEIEEVPADIGKLKNLTVLALDQNKIRSLPVEIGELAKLGSLRLHGNPLESLPEGLSRLSELKYLSLFDTHLRRKIPAGLLRLLEEGNPELVAACDWEAFDDIEEYRLDSRRWVEPTYEPSGDALFLEPYLPLGIRESGAANSASVFLYRQLGREVQLFAAGLEGNATVRDCNPDRSTEERIRERCKPELFSVSLRGTERVAVSRLSVKNVEVCGYPAISVAAQVVPSDSDPLLAVSSNPLPGPVVPRDSLKLKEQPDSIPEEDFGFPKGVHFKQVTFFTLPDGSENEFLAEVVTRGLHFIVGEYGKDHQWKEATWMFFVGPQGAVLLSPSSGEWHRGSGPDASFRAASDLDGNGSLDLILGTTDMLVLFRHRRGYLRKVLPYIPSRGC